MSFDATLTFNANSCQRSWFYWCRRGYKKTLHFPHSIEIISRFLVEGWDKTIYLFTTIRSGYLDIKAWLAGSGPEADIEHCAVLSVSGNRICSAQLNMSNCIVISIENLERIGTNVTIITSGPPIITRQLLRFLIATFILARRLDISSRTWEESEILIFSEIISLLFAALTRLYIGGGSLPLLLESARSREECPACPSYLSWVSA